MKRVLLALPLLAIAAFSRAIVIDDFTDGNQFLAVDSVSIEAYALVNASVLDGDRGMYVRQLMSDGPLRSTMRVANGYLSVSNEDFVQADSFLAYGADAVGAGGATAYQTSNDLSLGANNQLKFEFLRADLPLTLLVQFWDGSSPWTEYKKAVAPSMSPFTVMVTDADLIQGAPMWSNFDLMRVFFLSSPSGDFALDRIEAVPEPATLAALGVGLLALARRRTRR